MKMKTGRTNRGFTYSEFKDASGVECSLQMSSVATEARVWLGCNSPNLQHLVLGEGWKPYPVPEGLDSTTRMHLTQENVAALLPALQHFVATGELPE